MNFKYRLMQFMSGRYGLDSLFYLLFSVAALLSLVNIYARSIVLQLIVDIILVFAFFRVLSRNIAARRRENQALMHLGFKIREKQSVRRQRKADYTHIYKKCPQCHAVLRLPRRKGKHTTICPKCSKEFKVYVFKA